MGKVLANLECALKPDDDDDNDNDVSNSNNLTLDKFVKTDIKTTESVHWSSKILTEQNWGDLKLIELGYDNVRLLRSFSFAGDYLAMGGGFKKMPLGSALKKIPYEAE